MVLGFFDAIFEVAFKMIAIIVVMDMNSIWVVFGKFFRFILQKLPSFDSKYVKSLCLR